LCGERAQSALNSFEKPLKNARLVRLSGPNLLILSHIQAPFRETESDVGRHNQNDTAACNANFTRGRHRRLVSREEGHPRQDTMRTEVRAHPLRMSAVAGTWWRRARMISEQRAADHELQDHIARLPASPMNGDDDGRLGRAISRANTGKFDQLS